MVLAQECPLSAPLTLKDMQSGVVGETGTVWTISPDCGFTVARQIGAKIARAHRAGRLTPEQQVRLKELLDRLGVKGLPEQFGAVPSVNPRRIVFSYGGTVAVLNLPPGAGDLALVRGSGSKAQVRHLLDLVAAVKAMVGN